MKRKANVAVMTAISGQYDKVKPAPDAFEAHLFTTTRDWDDPTAADGEAKGWIVHRLEDRQHPRMTACVVKWDPWRHLPDHDVNIWIDGSYRAKRPMFARLGEHDLAAFASPWRECYRDELKFMNALLRYSALSPIQAIHMIQNTGMPARWGLWMTGLMVRDRRLEGVVEMHATMLRLVQDYTTNDQGLFSYACWRHGLRPVTLEGEPAHNGFAELYPHEKVGYSG